MKKTIILALVLIANLTRADEGMWLPQLLKALNEPTMQKLGFKLTAEQLYSVNKSSLKDAIGHFNGGCTSELVSAEGLLLTNHHCGYDQIQYHSSIANNYLRDGFWAMNKQQELPCVGLTVTFIVRIDDVTKQALAGVTATMTEEERTKKIEENAKVIEADAAKGTRYQTKVRSFFFGNEYYMFTTETFKDVRLVGAPPESVGKFGGDTDNWMWPRHTGDFSVFRIYANEKNEPCEYNAANKPYVPKKFLKVSTSGYKKGDFTLTYGFPGRTFQYLTSYGIKQVYEVSNPNNIKAREKRLGIWTSHMRANPTVRLQYASKHASVSNYYKKFQGENKGMRILNTMKYKQDIETKFQAWADASGDVTYKNLLGEFKTTYDKFYPLQLETDLLSECALAPEVLKMANSFTAIVAMAKDEKKTDDEVKAELEKNKKRIEDFYKDYDVATDKEVFTEMLGMYLAKTTHATTLATKGVVAPATMSADVFNSTFASKEKMMQLLTAFDRKVIVALENDKAYTTTKAIVDNYNTAVKPEYVALRNKIELMNRTWVTGLRAMQPTKKFWPDANSTLRVAYGTVEPYKPYDGAMFEQITHLKGVIEKMDNTSEEFTVPDKLLDLYNKKDFGIYADATGDVPVAFIATNHTTGGNSGSPLLDKKGRLLGLNFDTGWEGAMSNYHFDASRVRNISVDIRYVMFIMDKYAGAGHLVKEMTLEK
ncbi:MAG: S46 family peptidase [Bacteroidia bacterium]